MHLHCDAFSNNGIIPQRYTCDGGDDVPVLHIQHIPNGTVSLALIIDDPDATNGDVWDHCVAYNISPNITKIDESTIANAETGVNSWGNTGYGGPCPPYGSNPHRYFFKVYALDTTLEFPESPGTQALTAGMDGHIIDQTEYIGLYNR